MSFNCLYKNKNITKLTLKIHYRISNIKLNPYPYSEYQKKLIDKIIFLRKCGHTYKMISQYFNQINLLSYRGKKFSPSLVFELIKKHNRHLEKNKSKLGEIISSELVYEQFYKSDFNRYSYIWIIMDFCMKKLLLILICLFVSFEVKSKDKKSITKLIDYEKCMKEL